MQQAELTKMIMHGIQTSSNWNYLTNLSDTTNSAQNWRKEEAKYVSARKSQYNSLDKAEASVRNAVCYLNGTTWISFLFLEVLGFLGADMQDFHSGESEILFLKNFWSDCHENASGNVKGHDFVVHTRLSAVKYIKICPFVHTQET